MEHKFEKRFPANHKDYKLYEEVGEGVSATVYRALCIPLNEIVAIKVLDFEKCNNDLDGIRREVQTMSLIDHPNLVHAYCSFTAGHSLWVVMPYMAGGSALHIMKSAYPEGFEEPVIATLLREVLKALVYLHSHGHIHRDVKAGNILIDKNGVVKLADFGVSACMFDTGDRQRSRNTFVGTPCWMAPEVMQQLHGYDFKADIWSFGITALELAHGHAPFSKYPPMKVLLMTLQNAPPGLDYERDKRFSKAFKELVAMCLVKDPKKRPTSEKLLKHSFFKRARSIDYLSRSILDGLPPLGDRFKALKDKEANLLLQNSTVSEQLSQREYIKGISGWNFNLDDLKNQAALLESTDNDLQAVHVVENINLNEKDGGANFPLNNASKHDITDTSTEGGLQELQDLEGPFASAFPMRPLQALKACFDVCEDDVNASSPNSKGQSNLEVASQMQQSSELKDSKFANGNGENLERSASVPCDIRNFSPQKFSSGSLLSENILSPYKSTLGDRDDLRGRANYERNHSGPLIRQMRDSCNLISAVHEGPSEGASVQCKGRFHITSADINTTKVVPHLASCMTNPIRRAPKRSSTHTAAFLPSLQFLLRQNAMQKDQLVKLMKVIEQTSGISTDIETSDLHIAGGSQILGVSSTERQLQTYVAHLQQSIAKLAEDIQRVNSKNSQLEQQINALSVEGREVEDLQAQR